MKSKEQKSFFLFVLILFVVLSTYSCLAPNQEVTVQLQINKPSSEYFKIQFLDGEVKPLASFDVNITKVTVIVKKGTTKVFEQDFTSLNNISFKINDAGNYRIEAYAYANISGTTRGIFYGVKEQTLNYGTNFVTLEGVFFNGTLNFKIESTQSIADRWTYENCLLVLTKNSDPSNVLTYDLKNEVSATPVNFEKNITTEPGIWKVNFTLKLKNKNDNTEYLYTLPENSYLTLFPSATERLLISLQELESGVIANVRVASFTKPYVEPVRRLTADYSKSTDKLTLRWECPDINSSTKFQIFKKLKTQKGMQLIGETTNTVFETTIGNEFDNIEYYAVNVVKDGKESGPVEITDVLMKILEPAENSTLSRTVNVKTAVIDFAQRIKASKLYVDSVQDQSSSSFQTNFSLNTTKYIDGEHFVNSMFYDSSNNILVEDRIKINITNWQKVYSSGTGYDIVESNDKSGYIIVAYVDDTKIRVFKLSKDGSVIWNKEFFGIYIWGRNVITNANNGYIICGRKQVTDRGTDGYVLKIDETGSIVWEKTFGGTKNDGFYSVSKTSDGNYLLGGYKTNTYGTSDYLDGYLIKINESGNAVWEKTYGNNSSGSNFSNYGINAAKELKDKRIGIVGYGKDDSWLAIADSNGNVVTNRFFSYTSSSYGEDFRDFIEVDDGFVVSSYHYDWGSYYYIRKFALDASGVTEKWNYYTGQFSNVTLTSDNRVLFPYYLASSYYRIGITKVRNLSTYTSEWTWGSPLNGQIFKVIEDSNKDIIGVGVWNNNVLVIKIKGNGSWYY